MQVSVRPGSGVVLSQAKAFSLYQCDGRRSFKSVFTAFENHDQEID
jgi:hypothetical protein